MIHMEFLWLCKTVLLQSKLFKTKDPIAENIDKHGKIQQAASPAELEAFCLKGFPQGVVKQESREICIVWHILNI